MFWPGVLRTGTLPAPAIRPTSAVPRAASAIAAPQRDLGVVVFVPGSGEGFLRPRLRAFQIAHVRPVTGEIVGEKVGLGSNLSRTENGASRISAARFSLRSDIAK